MLILELIYIIDYLFKYSDNLLCNLELLPRIIKGIHTMRRRELKCN